MGSWPLDGRPCGEQGQPWGWAELRAHQGVGALLTSLESCAGPGDWVRRARQQTPLR